MVKITESNFNDVIKHIIETNSEYNAIYEISILKYPNSDIKIGKYAKNYYEAYMKYRDEIKLDENFDKKAYEKNKRYNSLCV